MADSSRVSRAGAGWGECKIGTARDWWLESCGFGKAGEASVNLPDVTSFAERAEQLPWASDWLRRLAQSADEIVGTPFGERPQFSWIQPVNILQSRNDFVGHRAPRLVDDQRRAWVKALGGPSKDGFLVDRSEDDAVSFLVVGDPGEGDVSQYSLVRAITAREGQTDFMFICSDVVYPAGSINQYTYKFYCPYKDYRKPIYAVPGNHDWYDGLAGFMYHFCGLEASDLEPANGRSESPVDWLGKKLWRKAEEKNDLEIARGRELRQGVQASNQPGPYFVVDTKPLRIVGIDTGILGRIDRDQGEWLRRVSAETDKPKVLITGKPIYVNGEYVPGSVEGSEQTIDDIVRSPENNYVAVIGGDTHNYQRYPVTLNDGRTINYVVSGGGGAYLSPTHKIKKIDPTKFPGEVDEDRFRCYPLRGDSLAYFSNLYEEADASWYRYTQGKAADVLGWRRKDREPGFVIPPGEASALMSECLHIKTTREEDRRTPVREKTRAVADELFNLRRRLSSLHSLTSAHTWTYAYLPWTNPPFFNNFLKVEADAHELTITCYGVTGCEKHENDPPVEDEVKISL